MSRARLSFAPPRFPAARLLALLAALVLVLIGPRAAAEPLDPKAVPEPLRPWVPWAVAGKDDAQCTPLDGVDGAAPRCAWPSRLELALEERGGRFTQTWHLDATRWVPLPGDERRWPAEVRVGARRAAVIPRDGVPSVRLERGDHSVTGTFAWDSLPESLRVPPETGLLSLTLRGAKIEEPNRDAKGTVWLQKTAAAAEGERLDIVVHRRVADEIPLVLTTRIVLGVAGKNREVVLGKSLPEGFTPMAVESPLPVRVEPDARLRVQVRPGTWTIELSARSEGPVTELRRPVADGPWREGDEVWVFDARPSLRLVEIDGVPAIDPQQTSLPDAWKQLPAYPMGKGSAMRLVERRRGDAEPPPDQLTLARTLWLDFDGKGFTASDELTGTLTRASRLEMAPPTVLGRVAIAGKDQFITHLDDAARTGVEVRQGTLRASADSRIAAEPSDLPAVGWSHDFHKVSATLHLPPGYRLFHAAGVDDVPSTWRKHWTLLELFLALVLSIAVARLFGPAWGAMCLVTLTLVFPESDAPRWVLVPVLALEALVRVLPRGAVKRVAVAAHVVSVATLVLVVVPFLVQHVREGMYPALADRESMHDDDATLDVGGVGAREVPLAPASPAPLASSEAPAAEEDDASGGAAGAQNVAPAKPSAPGDSARRSADLLARRKTSADASQKERQTYRQFNAEVYDPKSMVQTGPGRPRWTWTSVSLSWSGPVEHTQRLHLYLLSPGVNLLLALVRAALVVLLTLRLLPWTLGKGMKKAAVAAAALALFASPSVARAGEVPPKDVLDELATRLLAKPSCAPTCASSGRLLIDARPRALRLRLEVDASAPTAVPLPVSTQWTPETVLVDGQPAKGLLRTEDGKLWLAVGEGAHQITLDGALPDRELVQLSLPHKPHRVEAQTEGWRLEGVHEDGLADENVQLTRVRARGADATLERGVLPPFVRVERTLLVGLNWQVETRVVRLTPPGAAIVLEVPLLAGESVTTADVRVVGGKAQLNMAPQATELTWRSVLDEKSPIVLDAPRAVAWTELWRLDMSPIWHADFEGIPVVHAEPSASLPEWRPWPGEAVKIVVSRPDGVAGQTLTVDESQLEVRPGLRATDATLTLQVRSSRGAQHALTLPEGAVLESVTLGGKGLPIRQEGRRVTVPLSPGAQRLVLTWRDGQGIGALFRGPEVDLGVPSVNTNVTLHVSEGRWILFAGGPRLGPAVLFWSLFAVLLGVAGLLGARLRFVPLRAWEWMLLFIGLSQVPVVAAALVVGWFALVGFRGTRPSAPSRALFNLRQVAVVFASLIAMGILLVAVHQGLLGHPDMQIRGNASSATALRWFADRSPGALPAPWIVSVPLVAYRGVMLAWALWLALSVLRWLRWAWTSFGEGGLWQKAPPRPPPPPPPVSPYRPEPPAPPGYPHGVAYPATPVPYLAPAGPAAAPPGSPAGAAPPSTSTSDQAAPPPGYPPKDGGTESAG